MDQRLEILCTALLLTYPMFLLAIRFFRPRWMPLWLLVVLVSGIGWGLLNVSLHLHERVLADRVAAANSDELREKLAQESAAMDSRRTMAQSYGWLYGLGYTLLFLPPYAVANYMRSRSRERNPAGSSATSP